MIALAQLIKAVLFMSTYRLRAFAKINLCLAIKGRRPDGYHDIESLMQSIDLYDEVIIEESEGLEFVCSNPSLCVDNIGQKAVAKLALANDIKDPDVKITIIKNIPIGAGLAGGSADAAAVLLGLDEYWGLNWTQGQLLDFGASLGMDVPFCLHGGTCWVSGRGETIESLPPLDGFVFTIGIAPFQVSTQDAYGWFDRDGNTTSIDWVQAKSNSARNDWRLFWPYAKNTFESCVFSRFNILAAAKNAALSHPVEAVLMSGSGPTMVAVCQTEAEAGGIAGKWSDLGFRTVLARPVDAGVKRSDN